MPTYSDFVKHAQTLSRKAHVQELSLFRYLAHIEPQTSVWSNNEFGTVSYPVLLQKLGVCSIVRYQRYKAALASLGEERIAKLGLNVASYLTRLAPESAAQVLPKLEGRTVTVTHVQQICHEMGLVPEHVKGTTFRQKYLAVSKKLKRAEAALGTMQAQLAQRDVYIRNLQKLLRDRGIRVPRQSAVIAAA